MLINSVILKICLRKLDAKPNGSSTSSRSQTTLVKWHIQCEELHKGCVSQSNSKCILLNYNIGILLEVVLHQMQKSLTKHPSDAPKKYVETYQSSNAVAWVAKERVQNK